MGALKNYLDNLVCACSDEQFGQDAVEYAVVMGWVSPSMENLEADVALILSQYDSICEAYRREVARNESLLVESYGPLLAEIQRTT